MFMYALGTRECDSNHARGERAKKGLSSPGTSSAGGPHSGSWSIKIGMNVKIVPG
ncbi:hypothetical protein J6590_064326 [Homalodisca vitripennis]|nr:hypothetical protein J6590_064326 [Homalodisca vitripennis]